MSWIKEKAQIKSLLICNGGEYGARTRDLTPVKGALSQLS